MGGGVGVGFRMIQAHYIFFHILLKFFFTFYFIFNWRIIALQYCDGFCHTSTWMNREPIIQSEEYFKVVVQENEMNYDYYILP